MFCYGQQALWLTHITPSLLRSTLCVEDKRRDSRDPQIKIFGCGLYSKYINLLDQLHVTDTEPLQYAQAQCRQANILHRSGYFQ